MDALSTPGGKAERGSITQVETGERSRILLAGELMANGERRLTWGKITPTTRIVGREGGQTRPGSLADLTVGPQVEVTWAGLLLESYPAQGAVAEIVVHK